jgi:hypothetical protein
MRTLKVAETGNVSGSGAVTETIKVVLACGEQLWDFSKGLVQGVEDGWKAAGKSK